MAEPEHLECPYCGTPMVESTQDLDKETDERGLGPDVVTDQKCRTCQRKFRISRMRVLQWQAIALPGE